MADEFDKVIDEALTGWRQQAMPQTQNPAVAPPVLPASPTPAPQAASDPLDEALNSWKSRQSTTADPLDEALNSWKQRQTVAPDSPGKFASPEPLAPADNSIAEVIAESEPAKPATPDRSMLDAFTGGVQRGWKNTLSTLPNLKGVYLESQGDLEGAQAAFAEAQALEAEAPKATQGFYDISSVEDAAIWWAEKMGEQLPVIGAAVTGAGLTALAARFAGAGLMSSVASRALLTKAGAYVGGGATTIGMETAGIGSELREATGSYHPGVALAGGTAAGLLELVVPMSLTKALFGGKELGKNIATAIGKTAVMESATETGQESVALLARKYADPKFDLFTAENGWRLLESFATGAAVGGPFGGLTQVASRGGEAPGSERKVDPSELEGWGDRPVNWLRDKYQEWTDPRYREIKNVMRANPALDVLGASVLLDTVGIEWASTGVDASQVDAIGRFIEGNTKRYTHPLANQELLNATDLEELVAQLPPGMNIAADVREVNQGSISPIGITASLRDVPDSLADPRVFFLPGTTPAEKAKIEALMLSVATAKSAGQIESAEANYREALNSGLRVIPKYGSSHIYIGDVKGKPVAKLPRTGRTIAGYQKGFGLFEPGIKATKKETALDLERFPAGTIGAVAYTAQDIERRLVVPAGISKEQAFTAFMAEVKKAGNYETTAKKFLEKGIYIQPDITDKEFVFADGINPEDMLTTGISYPERYKTMPDMVEGVSKAFKEYIQKNGKITTTRVYDATTVEETPALRKLKELVPIFNQILSQMGLSQPTAISLESAQVLGTANGRYWPEQMRIEVRNDLSADEVAHTLAHEVGHHITIMAWHKLSTERQQEVWQAYRRHVLAFQQNNKQITRMMTDWRRFESTSRTFNLNYQLSFVEYLAEQATKWIAVKEIGASNLAKTFKEIGGQFERMYTEYAKRDKTINENLSPDYNFAEWMEWLKADRDNSELRLPMKRLGERLRIDRNHPMYEAANDSLYKEIERLQHLFPEGWKIIKGEIVGGELGVTYPAKKTVILALEAVEFGFAKVITHEAVHAVRDLITPNEWQALVAGVSPEIKAITKQWASHYRIEAEKLKTNYTWSQLQKDSWVKDKLEEEGVAIMMSLRAGGMEFPGPIATIMDKIIQLLVRLAQALGIENGWVNREATIAAFFKGEIALRDITRVKQAVYNKWLDELENARARFDDFPEVNPVSENFQPNRKAYPDKYPDTSGVNPEAIGAKREGFMRPANMPKMAPSVKPIANDIRQVRDDLWVAVFKENLGTNSVVAQYRFYTGLPPQVRLPKIVKDRQKFLEDQGREVGVVFLSQNPKGFEVDFVTVRHEFRQARNRFGRNEGFAESFYKYLEKDLGQKMKPSGLLLNDGYEMWKKRDPLMIRYHVYDAANRDWVSPNYIQQNIRLWSRRDSLEGQAELRHWTELRKKVDPKAWTDPDLDRMFHIRTKGLVYGTGLAMSEQQRGVDETVLTDVPGVDPGFEPIMAQSMKASQARNEKALGLEQGLGAPAQPEFLPMKNILKSNALTPEQKKLLKGSIGYEADRIGWFSKRWWGIHQLAWSNPHIEQLRGYVNTIERWAAKVEFWVNKADQTARNWERELNPEERARLADLLFYMTEMEYLTPAEKQRKVTRLPTPQEIQAAFRQFKIGNAGQLVYAQIEGNFAEFLGEIERISLASIEKEFIGQRVAGVPSPAELKAKAELAAEMAAMRSKPYFPMMRFGEWTLTVRDPNTNRVEAFYTFESQKERNDAIKPMSRQWAGSDLTVGRLPENVMEFVGIPAPLLRRIKATLPGIDKTQEYWLDQLANQMSPERSFRKRFMKRTSTPGYSLDAFRVFANYFQTGARYIARLEFKDEAQDFITDLGRTAPGMFKDSAKRSQIGSFMQSHLKYMQEGGRDWAKVKSLVAIWHLGYSPMAAMMNLTQMPMVTMPYLSTMFGHGASLRALIGAKTALKASFDGKWHSSPWPGYEKGRQELIEQGKIEAGQAPELAAYASANNLYKTAAGQGAARFLRTTAQHSMWMFATAERMNREMTYFMAFKMAMEDSNARLPREIQVRRMGDISDLMNRLQVTFDEAVAILSAREAIDRTHGIYAPWARPAFLRPPLANMVLTFFTYTQMMLYALRNNPGAWKHMLMLLAVAGMMGLPGADDLDRLVEAVARKFFGRDWSPKNEARKYINTIVEGTPYSKIGPDIFLHGISRYGFGVGLLPEGIGAPRFDASGNMSMGKIVPGLGEAATAWGSNQDFSKVIAQTTQSASGAGFGVMFNLLQFLAAAADPGGTEWKKWEKTMPRTLKGMSKAGRYAVNKEETFKSGAAFSKFDLRDPDDVATIIAQAMGATPLKLNQKWQANAEIMEKLSYWKGEKRILYEQLVKTVQTGDREAMAEVFKSIGVFNAKLREAGMGTMGIDSQRLRSSIENRTRSMTLQEMDLPATRSEMPAVRSIQDQYPEVEWRRVK